MAEIKYIATSRLLPHPQNPRKALGDLTELADSIKANGVMQNLTAVPKGHGYYTIIIGHRRHAAAKIAGLKELPCSIVNLSNKQQLQIMMIENMQRSDLTYYEQAQGFQLMLDLGDDVKSIAKSTGFSESTVRHRLKLTELDPEKLKASQERPVNLSDYAKLEKIKDITRRNNVLEYIGTDRFEYQLNNAIRDEEDEAAIKTWQKLFDENGIAEIPNDDKEYYKRYTSVTSFKALSTTYLINDVLTLVDDNENLFYRVSYGWIYIYKMKPIETEAEAAAKAAETEYKQDRKNRLETINTRFWERITSFVQEYKSKPNDITVVYKLLIAVNLAGGCFSIIPNMERCKTHINKTSQNNRVRIKDIFVDDVAKDLLCGILDVKSNRTCYTTDLKYYQNAFAINLLDTLIKLGFNAADDEIEYVHGTHEIFKERSVAND